MGKTNWDRYLEDHVHPTGRHKKFDRWHVTGVWEFTREDGAKTHHKYDSPCPFWRDTVEWSMELQDTGKNPYADQGELLAAEPPDQEPCGSCQCRVLTTEEFMERGGKGGMLRSERENG